MRRRRRGGGGGGRENAGRSVDCTLHGRMSIDRCTDVRCNLCHDRCLFTSNMLRCKVWMMPVMLMLILLLLMMMIWMMRMCFSRVMFWPGCIVTTGIGWSSGSWSFTFTIRRIIRTIEAIFISFIVDDNFMTGAIHVSEVTFHVTQSISLFMSLLWVTIVTSVKAIFVTILTS